MISAFPQAMPLEGFLGGVMIGTASAIMLLWNGRIAGVSGMFARALHLAREGPPRPMAVLFTLALPLGAGAVAIVRGVEVDFTASLPLLALAGLIVGVGSRLGSGCTSGHGVCGLARLSPRSLAATSTFMATGIATVTWMRLAGLTL